MKNEDKKQLIRRGEAVLQIIVFAALYFAVWKLYYTELTFPYLGRGKYILMGVYVLAFFKQFIFAVYCKDINYFQQDVTLQYFFCIFFVINQPLY